MIGVAAEDELFDLPRGRQGRPGLGLGRQRKMPSLDRSSLDRSVAGAAGPVLGVFQEPGTWGKSLGRLSRDLQETDVPGQRGHTKSLGRHVGCDRFTMTAITSEETW